MKFVQNFFVSWFWEKFFRPFWSKNIEERGRSRDIRK